MCRHAAALLLAWAHESYTFNTIEALSDAPSAPTLKRQWLDLLERNNLAQLRAIAKRHGARLRASDRAAVLDAVAEALAQPEALESAFTVLTSAQRRVLLMLFILSDGQPDICADDLQHALGWSDLEPVESALRELGEWGLIVSAPSAWQQSQPYALAPRVREYLLHRNVLESENDAIHADSRRAPQVATWRGELAKVRVQSGSRSLAEITFLARHLNLRARARQPELPQSRTLRALRHWPHMLQEVVGLQVHSGSPQPSEIVLSVPRPEPQLDDASLARLHAFTGDDALSDFLSHLMIPGANTPADLRELFARWQALTTWTELWLAQADLGMHVKRRLTTPHLSYVDWLHALARARRFVLRVLTVLEEEQWYDFESLLAFIRLTHSEFLYSRCWSENTSRQWWLEISDSDQPADNFDGWRLREGRFVESILRGPLCWFGALEIAEDKACTLKAFRVSERGEALLHDQPMPAPFEQVAPAQVSNDLSIRLP
ncbi:MAG: hypothetical protein LC737_01780, partial [Chloroflexi bacterium]|nr:hypothetical protein [Chloroflexota bacterium]